MIRNHIYYNTISLALDSSTEELLENASEDFIINIIFNGIYKYENINGKSGLGCSFSVYTREKELYDLIFILSSKDNVYTAQESIEQFMINRQLLPDKKYECISNFNISGRSDSYQYYIYAFDSNTHKKYIKLNLRRVHFKLIKSVLSSAMFNNTINLKLVDTFERAVETTEVKMPLDDFAIMSVAITNKIHYKRYTTLFAVRCTDSKLFVIGITTDKKPKMKELKKKLSWQTTFCKKYENFVSLYAQYKSMYNECIIMNVSDVYMFDPYNTVINSSKPKLVFLDTNTNKEYFFNYSEIENLFSRLSNLL